MPFIKDLPEGSIEVLNLHYLDRDVNATYLNCIVDDNPNHIIDDFYGRCSDELFEQLVCLED